MKTVVIAAVLVCHVILGKAQQCGVADPDKVDCGQVGTTETTCLAKGCCWQESKEC